MYKLVVCILFLLSTVFESGILSSENQTSFVKVVPIPCMRELQPCLDKILKMPEMRKIIASIQQNGNISINFDKNHSLVRRFGALWNPTLRTITLDSICNSEGILIGLIVFEMHNALMNAKFDELDYLAQIGQIGREAYIQAVEKIEYQNMLNASRLTHKAIQQGVFPREAYLPTYATFEEHYRVQKKCGHSAQIGQDYDGIASTSRRRWM